MLTKQKNDKRKGMVKMLNGLFIASIIGSCVKAIKEATQPTIMADMRANKELLNKDIIKGVPYEQIQKNIKNGKYKLTETYSEPHKDPVTGQIIIENCLLYKEDLLKHDGAQVMKWVKQGKYNLTPEELEKEHERIKAEFDHLFKLL